MEHADESQPGREPHTVNDSRSVGDEVPFHHASREDREHVPRLTTSERKNAFESSPQLNMAPNALPTPSQASAPLPIKSCDRFPTRLRSRIFPLENVHEEMESNDDNDVPPTTLDHAGCGYAYSSSPRLEFTTKDPPSHSVEVPFLDTTRELILDRGHEMTAGNLLNPHLTGSYQSFSGLDLIASRILAGPGTSAAPPTFASRLESLTGSQTFKTAHSSFASYATAPSGPSNLRKLLHRDATTQNSERSLVFSSGWLNHLQARGMILSPEEALDWSGRGQHVEYQPHETAAIPLVANGNLGYGTSGCVDKVRCRRIDLARKTIRCNRRLTKEEAVTEVEHLQRLQHRHIVRLVGTYLLKKDLVILLYPAAKWNLEEYMDELLENRSEIAKTAVATLYTFVGCLSNVVQYIHNNNVKHMDIKPKNVLIRDAGFDLEVYVADFGIARAYKCADDSYTDSPTPFTRLYAAPEVAAQESRGFPADMFSLGCVFMEIFAIIMTTAERDEREELVKVRSQGAESTYHVNAEAVIEWYNNLRDSARLYHRLDASKASAWRSVQFSAMLSRIPSRRPTAAHLRRSTAVALMSCGICSVGPKPFEAA